MILAVLPEDAVQWKKDDVTKTFKAWLECNQLESIEDWMKGSDEYSDDWFKGFIYAIGNVIAEMDGIVETVNNIREDVRQEEERLESYENEGGGL